MMHTTCPIALMDRSVELLACSFQSLLELVNSSAGINKLLLTGKEGMALGADFNSHFSAFSGLSCYGLAASTLDRHFFVIGMNSGLHFIYTSFRTDIHNALYYITNFLKMQEIFEKYFCFFEKISFFYSLLYKSSRKRAIIFFSKREI